MQKIILYIKRKIFLIEYLIFLLISVIGVALVNEDHYLIRFGLFYIALFSISHFVAKFCVYRYFKSFELKPLPSMILAFIITFHFSAPIPIVLLAGSWVKFWKLMYGRADLIVGFTLPAYLAFFATIFLYVNKKKNVLSDDIKQQKR